MTTENNQNNNNKKQLVPAEPKPQITMTSRGFMPTNMDEAWRFATALSRTNMVPQHYRGKPDECLIALDLAARLETNWLAVMQHTYDVHGRLGFEAKFVTALINRSGLFKDPLEYEVRGEDANNDDYAVRAYAIRKSTGKKLFGPWITWDLVRAEKWDKKPGSKWLTMPEQMFHYRSAGWFKNRHCPEVTIGIPTAEELEDTPERKQVQSLTYEETTKQVQEKIDKEMGRETVETKPEPEKEPENPPDDQEKPVEKSEKKKPGRKPKNKKPASKYKYVCLPCKSKGRPYEFDEPRKSGPNGEVLICPNANCLSADIIYQEENSESAA